MKKDVEYHLKRGDHYKFHEIKGHHIEEYIKFCQKVAIMLNLEELMIEAVNVSNEVKMMESQEEQLEVCRVQPIIKRSPKLILTKPSYANKGHHSATPYNYDYTSTIKTLVSLFQTKINGLTKSGHYT